MKKPALMSSECLMERPAEIQGVGCHVRERMMGKAYAFALASVHHRISQDEMLLERCRDVPGELAQWEVLGNQVVVDLRMGLGDGAGALWRQRGRKKVAGCSSSATSVKTGSSFFSRLDSKAKVHSAVRATSQQDTNSLHRVMPGWRVATR